MVGTAVTRVEVEVKRGEDGSDVHTEGRGIFPLVCLAEWFTEGALLFLLQALEGSFCQQLGLDHLA